jgi:hypothetical protein
VLRKATEVMGRSIRATDGDIGAVSTILFDDEGWTVRYFVVDTGKWLPGRKVLISPLAIRHSSRTDWTLDVSLTRDQVKNSPDVDTDRPVSRQHEMEYYRYYGYPYYWGGVGFAPGAFPVMAARGDEALAMSEIRASEETSASQDSHLRDAKAVIGYHLRAADGEIGHVEEFLVDVEHWSIRYMVVDTSNWLGGRRVLIAPSWVSAVSWEDSLVHVTATREAVMTSPEYDLAAEVERDYEQRLHSHYGRAAYWTDGAVNHERDGDDDGKKGERLARLDDLDDVEVAAGDPDVRGWRVIASDGLAIGKVEHLIIDRPAMKVGFLEVGLDRSGVAESRARDVLIPIEDVDLADSREEVRLANVASTQVSALPTFDGLPLDHASEQRFRAAFRPRLAGASPHRDVRLGRHGHARSPFTGSAAVSSADRSSTFTPGPEQIVNQSADARDEATRERARTRDPRLDDEDPR